jgi:hypothetical protein
METNFNFKSQPCTSREQSERLLALGLKKETADVTTHYEYGVATIIGMDYPYYVQLHTYLGHTDKFFENIFPAWSLHRLIEMYVERYISCSINLKDLTYEWIINEIEIHVKEGDFNKEYLV